nr:hypothetical protein [Tanacetum cinerariifolium]
AGTDRFKAWIITTTPGNFYLHQPLSKTGCAVLVPGQYKDAYQLGFHQNKPTHPALVQTGGKVRAYRDNDRDFYAEETKVIEEGHFGINIHRSNSLGPAQKRPRRAAAHLRALPGRLPKLLHLHPAPRARAGARLAANLAAGLRGRAASKPMAGPGADERPICGACDPEHHANNAQRWADAAPQGGGAYGTTTRYYIARLKADGTLDTAFGSTSPTTSLNNSISAIAVQPDGKILVGGSFTQYGSANTPRSYIARLDTGGVLDPTFVP